jgi:hypothetical protein
MGRAGSVRRKVRASKFPHTFHRLLGKWGAGSSGAQSQLKLHRAVVESLELRTMLSNYTVNTLADTDTGSDGVGSLRWAIGQAGQAGGNQTITFDPALFYNPQVLDDQGVATIALNASNGPLELDDTSGILQIEGPGADRLIISANGNSSVFVNDGNASIEGLTIAGGVAPYGGGGIDNEDGKISVDACSVIGNSAEVGGGIYSRGENALLQVADSTISGNTSSDGGGIYSYGKMTITNSTISGNSAVTGAALYEYSYSATVTDCTIGNNIANNAGAIDNVSGQVTLDGTIIENDSDTNELSGMFTGSDDFIDDQSGNFYDSTNVDQYNGVADGIPILGPLNYFGGPTETMLLSLNPGAEPGGGAFTAPNGTTINTDQRGQPRPENASSDVGAVQTDGADYVLSPSPVLVVNTLSDNSSPGEGLLSLPEAIGLAETSPGDRTITFDPALTADGPQTIDLTNGSLYLNDDSGTLDIIGPGAGLLTIDMPSSYCSTVVNEGSAELDGLTISGNSNGGGIENQWGTLQLKECTISGNVGAWGGGIYNRGILDLTDSTISGNTANDNGGGIYNYRDGSADIVDCTISGNQAVSGEGGGIYNYDTSVLVLTDSTIAGNSAPEGGGVFNSNGPQTIDGSIIANNSGGDLAGSFTGTNNLIGDATIASISPSSETNLQASAYLGALNYYGGSTETMPPLNGSPAMGAGAVFNDDTGNAIVTDQRGFPLPTSSAPNIGSFQTQSASNTGIDPFSVNTLQDDPVGAGQLSLRDAVNLGNVLGGDQTITFDTSLTANGPGTIDLAGNAITISDGSGMLTIVGPGADLLTINAASGDRTFANSDAGAIVGLTITGDDTGGGIFNDGILTVDNCTITGNTWDYGGGLYNEGIAAISDSTISGNSALSGGAVYNYRSGSTLDITESTITGDHSSGAGGGIYNGEDDTLDITNSTIYGNSAPIGGGVANNSNLVAVVDGTIVADSADGGDLSGSFTGTHDLIDDHTIGQISPSSVTNLQRTASLAALGYYGGPTETMPPLPGSPMIGTGGIFEDSNDDPIDTDQRGFPVGSAPDIGAFQTQSAATTGQSGLYVNTLHDDPLAVGQMSLEDATNLAESIGGGQPITFDMSLLTESAGSASLDGLLSIGSFGNINEASNDTLFLASAPTLGIQRWDIDWTDQNEDQLGSVQSAYGQDTTDTFGDAESAELIATVTAYNALGVGFQLPAVEAIVTPTAPSGLTASTFSQNQINLAWTTNSTMATQTEILISTDGTQFWPFDTVDSTTTTYQAVGLAPNTQYTFEVASTDTAISVSAPSSPVQSTTNIDPWDVQDSGNATTVAEGALYTLNLSVNPSSTAPTFDHFIVNWGDGTPSSTYMLAQLPATHVFATGIDSSIIDVSASTAADASSSLTVTGGAISVAMVPTAPTNVQTSTYSPTEVDLTWTDNSQDADGYEVLRSDDDGGSYNQIAEVARTDDSYDDTTVTPGETADYEIVAVGISTTTAASAPASAAPVPVPLTAPAPGMPTLSVAQSGANSAILTWAYAGTNDQGFELEEEDPTAGTNFRLIATPGPVGLSGAATMVLNNLNPDDEYDFRIRVDNDGGTASRYTLPASLQFGLPAAPLLRVYNTDLYFSTTLTKSGGDIRVGWLGVPADGSVQVEVCGDAFPGEGWNPITFGNGNTFSNWPATAIGSELGYGFHDYSGDADTNLQGYINDPETWGSGTYNYRIRSVTFEGAVSAWSQPQSAYFTLPGTVTAPTPSVTLTATVTTITAKWVATAPNIRDTIATDYMFLQKQGVTGGINYWDMPQPQAVWSGVGYPAPGGTTVPFTAVITGLTAGTQYNLCLWSTFQDADNHTESIGFSKVTITTNGSNLTAPAAPDNLNAVNLGDGINQDSVELIWDNSSNNEDGFDIEEANNSNFTGKLKQFQVGADVTNFIDTEPVSRKTVYYRVDAYRGNIRSAWIDVGDVLTQSPFATAISWFPASTPDFDFESVALWPLANDPPPTNFLSPGGAFDQNAWWSYRLQDDYRNILTLKVGYSVDPYSGILSVTPYGQQIGGYTPIPTPGGPTIHVAGQVLPHSPYVNFNQDRSQATVLLSGLFRLSQGEQPGAWAFNGISGHGGFHGAAWVWASIIYTISDNGYAHISFSGSAVPNQTDYIDGYYDGSYDVLNNYLGYNAFLAAPYGSVGPVDNR